MAIQKITADVISSDAITTASISDSAITAAKLAGTLDLTGKTITVATASSGDNDTSPASTAFVQQEISALVDSSPDALNTLNELAAALGDDANFSTTVTNSIATKLPLAGGTLSGAVILGTAAAQGNQSAPALRFGPSTYRLGMYTDSEGAFIENKNGDDGINFLVKTAGQAMRIDGGTGNVGIGNDNPSYKLSLKDTTQAGTTIQLFRTGSAAGSMFINGGLAFGADGGNGDTQRMVISSSTGNVGIGTLSPQDRLHVTLDSATTNAEVEVMRVEATSSGTPVDGFGPFIDFRGDRQAGNPDSYGRIGFESDGMTPTTVDGAFIIQTAEDGVYTERMRVSSGGNVAIGASSALDNKLEVNGGDIRVRGTSTPSIKFNNADQEVVGIRLKSGASGVLSFHTDKMVIDTSGNVGIGTTSPNSWASYTDSAATVLQVEDSSQRARIVINGGDGAHLDLVDYAGSANDKHMNIAVDSGVLKFGSLNDAGNAFVQNNIMTMDLGTGNVGIATTSPDCKLHVKTGTAQNDAHGLLKIEQTSTSSGSSATNAGITTKNHHGTSQFMQWEDHGLRIGSRILTNSGIGNVVFTAGSDSEYMRLDSSGHLIVGSNNSTTEAGKLSVYTDATNDPAIYGYRSTSSFKIVPYLSNGAFSSLSNVNDSGLFFSDNFVIAKHASGNYGAVFFGNGSFSIGTDAEATGSTGGVTFSADSSNRRNLILATTGTGNLELIEFRNPNGTVGTIKTNGTSTSYNTSSDYRLKENVTYEFNALDRVTQLKPARFNFITDADTVLDGFLAHEVSDIVPEAVSGEKNATKEKEVEVTPAQYEDDGETLISEAVMETRTVPVYQGIDQSKLVPLLTKAIQELKTELDAAKARITELEG